MEIPHYWVGVIFVPRSVNINTVSGMPDYAEISTFFLNMSWQSWKTDMTKLRTYFFLLMNAAISLKRRFISHGMSLNILCLSFDLTTLWDARPTLNYNLPVCCSI